MSRSFLKVMMLFAENYLIKICPKLVRFLETQCTKVVDRSAVRSVTLNLANKFSQCTFSVTVLNTMTYLAA